MLMIYCFPSQSQDQAISISSYQHVCNMKTGRGRVSRKSKLIQTPFHRIWILWKDDEKLTSEASGGLASHSPDIQKITPPIIYCRYFLIQVHMQGDAGLCGTLKQQLWECLGSAEVMQAVSRHRAEVRENTFTVSAQLLRLSVWTGATNVVVAGSLNSQ